MRRKRVLICDDNAVQRTNLTQVIEALGYEVEYSTDYRSLAGELSARWPIQLLILDLGFGNKEYVGHECIPDVSRAFPTLKIIVYSDILSSPEHAERASALAEELWRRPQVVGFLNPLAGVSEKRFAIRKALGDHLWSSSPDLWMLHVSDPQFGGSGLTQPAEALAESITLTVKSFCEANRDAKFPAVVCVTGDLTQRGRPEEFGEAEAFVAKLAREVSLQRSDMVGAIGAMNALVIPGNHDFNWDVSRARNLRLQEGVVRFGEAPDSSLDFIHRLAWIPFLDFSARVAVDDRDWAWDPGYRVVCLARELGLILVCLNSSRWTVDHSSSLARVPRAVFSKIRGDLTAVDPGDRSTRVLLVHHAPPPDGSRKQTADLLALEEAADEPEQLLDGLARSCGFSLVLTGHIHELAAREVNSAHIRKIVHVAAGTARSDDLRAHRNPQFNLLRLDRADGEGYAGVTVFPFDWNGARYCRYAAFGDGMKQEMRFALG